MSINKIKNDGPQQMSTNIKLRAIHIPRSTEARRIGDLTFKYLGGLGGSLGLAMLALTHGNKYLAGLVLMLAVAGVGKGTIESINNLSVRRQFKKALNNAFLNDAQNLLYDMAGAKRKLPAMIADFVSRAVALNHTDLALQVFQAVEESMEKSWIFALCSTQAKDVFASVIFSQKRSGVEIKEKKMPIRKEHRNFFEERIQLSLEKIDSVFSLKKYRKILLKAIINELLRSFDFYSYREGKLTVTDVHLSTKKIVVFSEHTEIVPIEGAWGGGRCGNTENNAQEVIVPETYDERYESIYLNGFTLNDVKYTFPQPIYLFKRSI